MLYTYGFRLGMKLVRRGCWRESLRYLVVPVNYWRTKEYALVAEAAGFRRTDRILDIGSPKLLSLYLADKVGAEVYSTDIEDYFIREYQLLRRVQGVPQERLHLSAEDGRRLTFGDGAFTKVYSVSVLEHIPDDGDVRCAAEIGRVLAPGGTAILTVPFAPASRDEYTKPRFYWHRSSRAGSDGMVFYQRRYSEADLFKRLIEPSGLRLRALKYVGERISVGSRHELCEFLPKPTGPVQPLISKLIHTAPSHSWRRLKKPLCALIVLEKPPAVGQAAERATA